MQAMLTIEQTKKLLDEECKTWPPEQRTPLYSLVECYGFAGAVLLCIDRTDVGGYGADLPTMCGDILSRIAPDQYELIEAMYYAHMEKFSK